MIFMANQNHNEFMNSNTKGTIIFYSTNTNVLVLPCYHAPHFMNADVFWEPGTTTKYDNTHRFVPVIVIMKTMVMILLRFYHKYMLSQDVTPHLLYII